MKCLALTLLVFNFMTSAAFADSAHSDHVDCNGIKGLKLAIAFKSDTNKKYISKSTTELYTTFRDDIYFTHIMADQSLFTNGNLEIQFEIINHLKQPIKKYVLNKWSNDKDYPNKKINKMNFTNFATTKLSDPFDRWDNLSKAQKARADRKNVPFDGKFYIGRKNEKPICVFDFKYGTGLYEDAH